jgi:hypothetical protein
MNKQLPLYWPDDIVLYIHRITAVDFTPMKVVRVLGQDAIGMYWYILVDERRVLAGIRESWLKSAEGLTAKQIDRLNTVTPREEQLASLAVSILKTHRLTHDG